MAEEIGFENGRNLNFQGLVTLTLDPAYGTVVHHSSTSTYIPNFIEIGIKIFWKVTTEVFGQVQSHVTQKLGQISKIRPGQI